jgi:ribonuclease HI
MTERGRSAGDGSGPKTRYHLLTTDGSIVAARLGKAAGEAAIGVVLKAPLEEISEPIGPAKDHHVAKYRALIIGLEAARSRGIGHLRVCLDSALLVNQLNDRWQVKAEHLKPLHKQAVSLIQQFRRHQDHVGAPSGERRSGRTCEHPTWAAEAQAETFNRRTSTRIALSVRSSAQPAWGTSRPLPTSPESALDRQSDLVLAESDRDSHWPGRRSATGCFEDLFQRREVVIGTPLDEAAGEHWQ